MIWDYYMPSIDLPRWRNARRNKKAGPIADRISYKLPPILHTCRVIRYDASDLHLECLREHHDRVQRTVAFTDGTRPRRMEFESTNMQLVVTKNEITKAEKGRVSLSIRTRN